MSLYSDVLRENAPCGGYRWNMPHKIGLTCATASESAKHAQHIRVGRLWFSDWIRRIIEASVDSAVSWVVGSFRHLRTGSRRIDKGLLIGVTSFEMTS